MQTVSKTCYQDMRTQDHASAAHSTVTSSYKVRLYVMVHLFYCNENFNTRERISGLQPAFIKHVTTYLIGDRTSEIAWGRQNPTFQSRKVSRRFEDGSRFLSVRFNRNSVINTYALKKRCWSSSTFRRKFQGPVRPKSGFDEVSKV